MKVAIFGSFKPVNGESLYQFAYELGLRLGERGHTVVNGGYDGTMEAASKGAKDAGGKTIGVTLEHVPYHGVCHNKWLDEVIPQNTLLKRIEKLVELGDAFVVLPGGTGTLAELALAWEMMNKGFIKQKSLVLVGDFWKPLVEMIDSSARIDDPAHPRFKAQGPADYIRFAETVDDIIDCLEK